MEWIRKLVGWRKSGARRPEQPPRGHHWEGDLAPNKARDLLRTAERIFVAYAHDDRKTTEAFVVRLRRLRGKASSDTVFFDRESLEPGTDASGRRFEEALNDCTLFAIICSARTTKATRVNQELLRALERLKQPTENLRVLPLLVGRVPRLPDGIHDAIQAVQLDAVFPGLRLARYAPALAGIALLLAAVTGVLWWTGTSIVQTMHFHALSNALDVPAAADLGEELGASYAHVWMQRFAGGAIILLTDHADVSRFPPGPGYNDAAIILQKEPRRWFMQHRPPSKGDVYSVPDFASYVTGAAIDTSWESRLGWQSALASNPEKMISLFRPHAESPPYCNLSGGTAAVYARYHLDRYIGDVTEHQYDGWAYVSYRKNGYVIGLLPDLVNRSRTLCEDRKPETILVLRKNLTEDQVDFSDVTSNAGGMVFHGGNWSTVAGGTRLESAVRPSWYFRRDRQDANEQTPTPSCGP